MRYLQLSPVPRLLQVSSNRGMLSRADRMAIQRAWLQHQLPHKTCRLRPRGHRQGEAAATSELWRLRPEANLAGSETVLQEGRTRDSVGLSVLSSAGWQERSPWEQILEAQVFQGDLAGRGKTHGLWMTTVPVFEALAPFHRSSTLNRWLWKCLP